MPKWRFRESFVCLCVAKLFQVLQFSSCCILLHHVLVDFSDMATLQSVPQSASVCSSWKQSLQLLVSGEYWQPCGAVILFQIFYLVTPKSKNECQIGCCVTTHHLLVQAQVYALNSDTKSFFLPVSLPNDCFSLITGRIYGHVWKQLPIFFI